MVVGAVVASAAVVVLAGFGALPLDLSLLEVFAVVTGAWSVWTLSHNQPIGWWIGLGSVAAFGVVFFQARLFAEVGIQAFYFVTSLQAIWIWLRGGTDRTERPVTRAPHVVLVVTVPLGILALCGLWQLLIALHGAAPFWDALTVVMSLTAHLYLMWRFVDSWYLWISVDVIYLPLYVSRGLALTAVLYAGFLVMSVGGLRRFRALIPERAAT
jgi:nicotinamide mononucleotide transporter